MIPQWARNALANLFVPRNIFVSQLDVATLEIKLPGLPAAFDGFTIAQVSDLHVGRSHSLGSALGERGRRGHSAGERRHRRQHGRLLLEGPACREAASVRSAGSSGQSPAWTHTPSTLRFSATTITMFRPRAGDTGNELDASGITVLNNEAVCLTRGSDGISLVGLTDEEDSFERGLDALQTAARPRIALIHIPDLAEKIPYGAADLVLAGHTHGGQFTLPFLERLIVRHGCGSNYVEGLNTINDMPVYINRGLGYTGFPVRFRARPEVTLIRLVR